MNRPLQKIPSPAKPAAERKDGTATPKAPRQGADRKKAEMQKGRPDEDDFARVTVETPFDARWLESFIADPQRLLRINSMLEFTRLEPLEQERWRMSGRNLAGNQPFDLVFSMQTRRNETILSYDSGLKKQTKITIESAGDGPARLVITDDYSGHSSSERKKRLNEVDRSIIQWGHDIHRYLQGWKRWSWIPGWKYYMLRIWQGMKPSARRISFLIMAITAAEFALFLFVLVIFWLELPRLIAL